MRLKLGDYIFDLSSRYDATVDVCKDYIYDGDEPADFVNHVSDEDILFEISSMGVKTEVLESAFENIAHLRAIARWATYHDAFLMHGVAIDVEGTGVIFTARSGTGKTTHMKLWEKLLGDKMKIINGDKPFIRFFPPSADNESEYDVYAYGTPWCGKEGYHTNAKTRLKHICFIERSETNSCTPLEPKELINRIMNQVHMPNDPMAMTNTLMLINRLLENCKLWLIKCNMDIEAAEVAYNTLFNKGEIDDEVKV